VKKQLYQNGFMTQYETWVFMVVAEKEDGNSMGIDKMDKMLEDMKSEFKLNIED
jgi:hypothetical protein